MQKNECFAFAFILTERIIRRLFKTLY